MEKQHNVAHRLISAGIQLDSAAGGGFQDPNAGGYRDSDTIISAATVDHDDIVRRGLIRQAPQKVWQTRRFVNDWDDHRNHGVLDTPRPQSDLYAASKKPTSKNAMSLNSTASRS